MNWEVFVVQYQSIDLIIPYYLWCKPDGNLILLAKKKFV